MPADKGTLIAKVRRLLWFEIDHRRDGKIVVRSYTSPRILNSKASLTRQSLVQRFSRDIREKWNAQQGSTERIVAQIADHKTRKFVFHYYSIGIDDRRVASYFILDADGKNQELPGNFDWQAPLPIDNTEKFFKLKKSEKWQKSKTAFKTLNECTIVMKVHLDAKEYLGIAVQSELRDYPYGRLLGALPFGSEGKFLAMCRLDGGDSAITWKFALEQHKSLFNAWNVICRERSKIRKVFIEGEPGSGKEVWLEAIEKGSKPHRGGDWKKLAATLPTEELRSFLYGMRSGELERQGFLSSCKGGGVFIDEIGKSEPDFRKDLLRVLEAGEFVPIGGAPKEIDNILFVFASTPDDRKNAHEPPDFWTRMDVELRLPAPITLQNPGRASLLEAYDDARFYSLLGHFWFTAFREICPSAEVGHVLADYRKKIFKPIVDLLKTAAEKRWPRNLLSIPISPRRIRSLAANLVSEHQWVGYAQPVPSSDPRGLESAQESYHKFVEQFVGEFFDHLVQDEENRIKQVEGVQR